MLFRASIPAVTSLSMASMLNNGALGPAVSPVGGLSALSTEGGEVIVINGTNLGPALPRSYVSAVWYGDGTSERRFDVTNCTFTVPHTQLECVTLPGTGAGYRLQVRVAD